MGRLGWSRSGGRGRLALAGRVAGSAPQWGGGGTARLEGAKEGVGPPAPALPLVLGPQPGSGEGGAQPPGGARGAPRRRPQHLPMARTQ